MTLSSVSLLLFATLTNIQGAHKLCHNAACFDNDATQISVTFDGDDLLFVDFSNKSVVWQNRIPSFVYSLYMFNYSVNFQFQCKFHLGRWKRDTSVSPVPAAPEVLLYPKDEVIEQTDSTLICFARNFFPPTVKIKWTKNREVVASEDDPFEKTIPASAGTFQVFSRLSFIPKDGDVFGCIVEHETLTQPAVRFFEFHSSAAAIGPTAYCAVCMTVGIIAFAAGIFLFCRDIQKQNV